MWIMTEEGTYFYVVLDEIQRLSDFSTNFFSKPKTWNNIISKIFLLEQEVLLSERCKTISSASESMTIFKVDRLLPKCETNELLYWMVDF